LAQVSLVTVCVSNLLSAQMIVALLPLALGLVQHHGAAEHGKDASGLLSALLPLVSADGFQVSPRAPLRAHPGSTNTPAGVLRSSPVMVAEPKVGSEGFELQGTEAAPLTDDASVVRADRGQALAHSAKAAPLAMAVAASPAPAVAIGAEGFDKILEDFFLLFPLIFTGALVTYAAGNFALKYFEGDEAEGRMGEVMQFLPIAAAGGFAVLCYTQPGFFLFPLKTASGLIMKTAFDGWNLVAPTIGLGGAVLKY